MSAFPAAFKHHRSNLPTSLNFKSHSSLNPSAAPFRRQRLICRFRDLTRRIPVRVDASKHGRLLCIGSHSCDQPPQYTWYTHFPGCTVVFPLCFRIKNVKCDGRFHAARCGISVLSAVLQCPIVRQPPSQRVSEFQLQCRTLHIHRIYTFTLLFHSAVTRRTMKSRAPGDGALIVCVRTFSCSFSGLGDTYVFGVRSFVLTDKVCARSSSWRRICPCHCFMLTLFTKRTGSATFV